MTYKTVRGAKWMSKYLIKSMHKYTRALLQVKIQVRFYILRYHQPDNLPLQIKPALIQ